MTLSGPQYMLISALGFAIMGALVKVAGSGGIPVMQIILVRALVSAGLSLHDIRRAGRHPLGERRGWLLARGIVGFLSLSCVYYAVLHLPYAQATLLQYLHPVFTSLLAYLILREVPGLPTVVCVMLSLAGLVAMLAPAALASDVQALNWIAVIAGLAGAFGSGLAYAIVRKLATSEHPSVIVLYFPLICLPAATLLGWRDFVWPQPHLWLVLLGVGVFTQMGQVGLTKAMQTDAASRAASLSYVQIIFAGLLGWIFFAETPSRATYAGAALILAGAAANVLLHNRQQRACKDSLAAPARDDSDKLV